MGTPRANNCPSDLDIFGPVFLGFAKSKVKVEYAAMDVWVALRLYQQSFGCTRGWFHALLLILATLENHFGAKVYYSPDSDSYRGSYFQ